MEVLSLLVNVVMAGLLIATLVYCGRLNRRIRVLQDSRSELAKIIREFDESTQRATQSIAEIHHATQRLSDNIQHKIDKANFLANDLDMLIERGGKLVNPKADIRPAREPMRPPVAPSLADLEKVHQVDIKETAPPAAMRPTRSRSRAEQDLMSVLKAKK